MSARTVEDASSGSACSLREPGSGAVADQGTVTVEDLVGFDVDLPAGGYDTVAGLVLDSPAISRGIAVRVLSGGGPLTR